MKFVFSLLLLLICSTGNCQHSVKVVNLEQNCVETYYYDKDGTLFATRIVPYKVEKRDTISPLNPLANSVTITTQKESEFELEFALALKKLRDIANPPPESEESKNKREAEYSYFDKQCVSIICQVTKDRHLNNSEINYLMVFCKDRGKAICSNFTDYKDYLNFCVNSYKSGKRESLRELELSRYVTPYTGYGGTGMVHVNGYTKANGTYVNSYSRSYPHSKK